jgi:hypothetical protein
MSVSVQLSRSYVGSKKYSDDGLGFRVQRGRLVIEAKTNYFWKKVILL